MSKSPTKLRGVPGPSGPSKASSGGQGETAVSFVNPTTKTKLVGRLRDVKGSDSVVILCHGFSSNKDSFVFPELAAAFAACKVGSLRFDFSGNGESGGVFEFGNYRREASDLRAAVQYVREKLKKKALALIGHSKGANVVLLYTSMHDVEHIPAVVNIAGRFDMKQGITRRCGEDIFERLQKMGQVPQTGRTSAGDTFTYNLTKASMQERLKLDMGAICSAITLSEVLSVHGSADDVVPVQDAKSIAERISQHTMVVVPDADHSFTKPPGAAKLLIKTVVDFVCQELR